MKRIKFRYIFAAYAVVLSCVCMFLIYPANDDFYYASPKPGINILKGIMPTKTHWRPFDRLIEYGLGYAPFLFPWVNHILVVSSHLILCASLYVILRKITRRRLYSAMGTLFFCLSPGIIYTVTIKHYCQIIGGSISSIDTLAFFLKPRNYAVLAFTGIVSTVFLCFVIAMVYGIFRNERKTFNIIAGLFTCALYISSPYTVMAHVSEATAYEMAFIFALIFGIVLSSSRMSRAFVISCALMFLCMISVCCHKIYILHEWSLEIRSFLCEHKADFRNTPSKIFIYFIEDISEEGYSLYWYTPGHGVASGQAFLSLWEWKPKFRVKHVSSDADVNYPRLWLALREKRGLPVA